MGAIRWKDQDQLEAVNEITFDKQTELYQLHLAPEYQNWLTWEQDGAFLHNIRHRQKQKLESTVMMIEGLYVKCLVNDRKMQQDKRAKRWSLLICMGGLLVLNIFPQSAAVYMHLLNWQFSIITMILAVYLALAMSRVFLNAPPVSRNIPLLGMSKYERNVDELMWKAFKLRIDLKNEFNPQ